MKHTSRILGHKYKILNGWDVADEIAKVLKEQHEPLTNAQLGALRRGLGFGGMNGNLDMPFQAYEWDEDKVEGKSFLWRLSIPLLTLYTLIIKCTEPIHWVLTGKMQYSTQAFFIRFGFAWCHKVFD